MLVSTTAPHCVPIDLLPPAAQELDSQSTHTQGIGKREAARVVPVRTVLEVRHQQQQMCSSSSSGSSCCCLQILDCNLRSSDLLLVLKDTHTHTIALLQSNRRSNSSFCIISCISALSFAALSLLPLTVFRILMLEKEGFNLTQFASPILPDFCVSEREKAREKDRTAAAKE